MTHDAYRRGLRTPRVSGPGQSSYRIVYAFTLPRADGEHYPAPYRATLQTIRLLHGRPLWETRLEVRPEEVDENGIYTAGKIKTDF